MTAPGLPLRDALAGHLEGYPWAHFHTLTFRPPRTATERQRGRIDPDEGEPWGRFTPRHHPNQAVGLDYAMRSWRRFLHDVQDAAGARLFWFYGIEYGEKFGRLHIHALTGNTERIPTDTVRELWRSGWARVLVYDTRKGAGWYCAKYVAPGHELDDWDVSDSPEQAAAWWAFRNSDRAQVERLTRAAQARLRGREHAGRHALPPEQQLTLNGGLHDVGHSSPTE